MTSTNRTNPNLSQTHTGTPRSKTTNRILQFVPFGPFSAVSNTFCKPSLPKELVAPAAAYDADVPRLRSHQISLTWSLALPFQPMKALVCGRSILVAHSLSESTVPDLTSSLDKGCFSTYAHASHMGSTVVFHDDARSRRRETQI